MTPHARLRNAKRYYGVRNAAAVSAWRLVWRGGNSAGHIIKPSPVSTGIGD